MNLPDCYQADGFDKTGDLRTGSAPASEAGNAKTGHRGSAKDML